MDREDASLMDGDMITPWRKSSYSDTGANCVEVGKTKGGKVAVRDSKDPDGPVLILTMEAWREFAGRYRTQG